MYGGIDNERTYSFVGPDGTLWWSGVMRVGLILEVVSAETSVTIAPGEPLEFDAASSVSQYWDNVDLSTAVLPTPRKHVIGVTRSDAAASEKLIGVATEHIRPGRQGRAAGMGSIVGVKCITAASITNNSVGACVISDSANAGQVQATTTIPTVPGACLGNVWFVAGTGTGQSGSLTQLGILVNPR